jgi:hypothetical protein
MCALGAPARRSSGRTDANGRAALSRAGSYQV